MSSAVVYLVLIMLIVWLAGVTFLLWKIRSHYYFLTAGVEKKALSTILESMSKELHVAKKDIALLLARCDNIEQDELLHIQKIGLLRFNPFKDTGGDQSFVLSLVDANYTGVVISGLYSRSGTRWYAKKVLKGNGVDHELSDEETKALKLASA